MYKKTLPLLLALCIMLCGCGASLPAGSSGGAEGTETAEDRAGSGVESARTGNTEQPTASAETKKAPTASAETKKAPDERELFYTVLLMDLLDVLKVYQELFDEAGRASELTLNYLDAGCDPSKRLEYESSMYSLEKRINALKDKLPGKPRYTDEQFDKYNISDDYYSFFTWFESLYMTPVLENLTSLKFEISSAIAGLGSEWYSREYIDFLKADYELQLVMLYLTVNCVLTEVPQEYLDRYFMPDFRELNGIYRTDYPWYGDAALAEDAYNIALDKRGELMDDISEKQSLWAHGGSR